MSSNSNCFFCSICMVGRRASPIVPILCSFDPEFFFHPEFDHKTGIFRDFTSCLNRAIAESPGRTCVIASVDLDHIGPRYGDVFQPGQADINRSLEADRELLALMSQGEDDRFLHTAPQPQSASQNLRVLAFVHHDESYGPGNGGAC